MMTGVTVVFIFLFPILSKVLLFIQFFVFVFVFFFFFFFFLYELWIRSQVAISISYKDKRYIK